MWASHRLHLHSALGYGASDIHAHSTDGQKAMLVNCKHLNRSSQKAHWSAGAVALLETILVCRCSLAPHLCEFGRGEDEHPDAREDLLLLLVALAIVMLVQELVPACQQGTNQNAAGAPVRSSGGPRVYPHRWAPY